MKYIQNKELMKRIEKLLNENFEKVNKMMRKANKESLENLIDEDLNLAQISETQKKSSLPDDGQSCTHEDETAELTMATNICMKILQFFQLLCEGHNLKLQLF
jgi:hypothetical protein